MDEINSRDMSEARLLKALGDSKEMKGEGRLNRGLGGSGRGGVGGESNNQVKQLQVRHFTSRRQLFLPFQAQCLSMLKCTFSSNTQL